MPSRNPKITADTRPPPKERAAALRSAVAPNAHTGIPSAPNALIAALTEAWAAHDAIDADGTPAADAAADRAYDRISVITKAIERLPATRENLLAKTVALARIEAVDLLFNDRPRESYATDGRLAFDVRETVLCTSALAAPTDDFKGLLDPSAVTAAFNVEGLPIDELAALHGVAQTFSEIGNAMLCQPRCIAGQHNSVVTLTAAGCFSDWMTELASWIVERSRQQASRYRPSDESGAEERLFVLAGATAINGDPAEMRAFARDLEAQAGRIEARG